MPNRVLARRTLHRALEILGSERALARKLHVPRAELCAWLAGVDTPPTGVFLSAVDVVIEAMGGSRRAAPAYELPFSSSSTITSTDSRKTVRGGS